MRNFERYRVLAMHVTDIRQAPLPPPPPGESIRITCITWSDTFPGRLHPSVHKDLQRLVIPLPSDGSPLPLRIVKSDARQ
ncbi:MAG: hypothetical protein LBK99_17310 [Opitutaceae bacterium]|jgi:hypothetical protein|nr:hypothetical protein [Opitutaceae bacterium]